MFGLMTRHDFNFSLLLAKIAKSSFEKKSKKKSELAMLYIRCQSGYSDLSDVSINFDFAPYLMIRSYVSYNLPTQVVIGRVHSFRFSGSMGFERFESCMEVKKFK